MSSPFDLFPTRLAGLTVLQRKPIGDTRGFLERLFSASVLGPLLEDRRIVQINRTLTATRGTVRGMHFQQPPHADVKFVTCLRGTIFDVAVDLRRGSPTFLQWHAEELSGTNHRTLMIPEGFAHGFQALSNDCEMLYLHTNEYAPAAEGALNSRDSRLAIAWPEPIAILSERDASHPMIGPAFEGIAL